MQKVLYLGLEKGRFPGEVTHAPMISVVPKEVKGPFPFVTHALVTSRQAAFLMPIDHAWSFIALGEGTREALRRRGVEATLAKEATQEGMVRALEEIDKRGAHFFWGKSAKARDLLRDYLAPFPHTIVDLYDLIFLRIEEDPMQFDLIVFTAPSTVDAYVEQFGVLPPREKIKAIGPITQKKIDFLYASRF